jgi:hypothetical protein
MIAFLPSLAFAALPPDSATWSAIQTSPVKIECTTWQDKPYCRSTGVIGAALATATDTFATLDQHTDKMGSIKSVERLEPDVLHVVMDYPAWLSDRDYVARFKRRTDADGTEVFAWTPITDAKAPPIAGVIRLTWLEGEWRFKDEGGGNTRVTYVWEADPGGGLPNANLVWKKAGTYAVTDMASACGTKIVAP